MRNKKITLQDIAGFSPEEAIWKMMSDVSAFLIKEKNAYNLSPHNIIVAGESFIIESNHETDSDFYAPEQNEGMTPGEAQMIWSIGALAYYMATGHIIFGGHGGCYQKEHEYVSLPTLPKGLQALTSVTHKCLCADPQKRIGMNELHLQSLEGLTICKRQERKAYVIKTERKENVKHIGEKWPEEMTEI